MTELLDVLKTFNTDKDKEREGVWVEIELTEEVKLEVKITASKTKAYQARLMELLAPYREQLGEGKAMTDEESDEVFAKAIAGTLLVDWRNLVFKDAEIPFSEKTAVLLLTEVPDLRERIAAEAKRQERFRFENVKAVADRLGKTLGGGSKTPNSSRAKRSRKGSPKG